jgi:DNA transposition AAA+ family ATPase
MDPITLLSRYAPGDRVHPDLPGQGFKLILDPFPHRHYRNAMHAMAELHVRRRKYGVGGGLLLTGPSGVGKSTMVRAYLDSFPRVHETERTHIPVLLVSVPSSPTSRSLASAILEALGYKKAHRGTAPEMTARIHELFMRCEVEMVLLDEFQHLFYAPTLNAFRDVTDWLKNFLEATKVGMVACGLPAAEAVVNSNEQLARRFSARIRVAPFAFVQVEDSKEFRGVLKTLGTYLPIPPETPLHESNLARRIHVGSYGLIDYVIKILEGAVSVAASAGLDSLDLETFAAGFRNRVWRDVPERLNPFHPQSVLRALDRPGEVFQLHTRQDLVGSPVARKLGMNLSKGNPK